MYLNEYALQKIAESRLAELRADAARRALLAPAEDRAAAPREPSPPPRRWILVQLLGR